jgi:hypothetical protein
MPSVPLNVHEHTSYDRHNEPVTSGIPWPQGALRDTNSLKLMDGQGRALPLQARPLAYWPDGSVKWSLLTTRLNANGGKVNRFRLDAPDRPGKARPRAAGKGLKLIRGRQSIVIDTGVLRLTVDTRNGGFITDVRVRKAKGTWTSLVQPGGISLFVNRCDPDGGNRQRYTNGPDTARDRRTVPQPPPDYTNNAVDPAYAVTVIEEGPERVGLRIGGTHGDGKGRRFCPYVVTLYAYRDSTRLELHHTLVYTGVPQQDLIAGFGIEVPLRLAEQGRRYHFAEDVGPGIETKVQPTPDHPRWLHGRLSQLTSTGYRSDKWTGPDCGPVKIMEGTRNQGWARLGDERIGCLAVVRDFWQQYPKAFEVDAEAGLMKVELWPSSGSPWDLRRYSRDFHSQLYEYSPSKLGPAFPEASHGARGISKTHELALWFQADSPADRQELARTALGFTQPLMLLAEPDWYCRSGALGAIAPHDPVRFPHPERTVTDYIDFMLTERERNKWYGMVDYGDVQMTHTREDYNVKQASPDPETFRWLFDIGGHAWINTEHRPDQGLWLTFFRTGRPDYFEAAAAMTRHNRDCDVYHWGNFKGSGSRHNVNHWGCADKEWRVSNPISLRWHYYLTGNAWTREAMEEAIRTYQDRDEFETSTYTGGGALLSGLLVRSELSGAAADVQVVRALADVFAGMFSPSGNAATRMRVNPVTGKGSIVGDREREGGSFFLLGFGCMQTLVEVAELLDHRALSDGLVRYAAARFAKGKAGAGSREGGPYAEHTHVFSHAWRRTGDRRYLAFICRSLTSLKTVLHPRGRKGGCLDTPPHHVPIYSGKQTCWMLGSVCMEAAFGMKVLAEADGNPRGRRGRPSPRLRKTIRRPSRKQ